eukprot:716662-Rhodomonas_salina.1
MFRCAESRDHLDAEGGHEDIRHLADEEVELPSLARRCQLRGGRRGEEARERRGREEGEREREGDR